VQTSIHNTIRDPFLPEETVMRIATAVVPAVLVLSGSLLSAPIQAQSLPQAQSQANVRYLAANCANCHGTNGRSVGGTESLAGYEKVKFIERMAEFKSGKRPATLMHQLSKGYSDEQIARLAEFFATLPAK